MEKKFEWTEDLIVDFLEPYHSKMGFVNEGQTRFNLQKFKERHSAPTYPEGILSFIGFYGDIKELGSQVYNEWVYFWLNHQATIRSVKNSHGEVLTVNDSTNIGRIQSFEIVNEQIASHIANRMPPTYIDNIHPVKPVFKTADGFEMKDMEHMWVVETKNNFNLVQLFHDNREYLSRGDVPSFKCFKEKANAEKYIFDHAPVFSREELTSISYGISMWPMESLRHLESIKNLVNSKK